MDLAGVGQGHPPVFLPSDFFEGRGRCFILVSGPLYSFGGGIGLSSAVGAPYLLVPGILAFLSESSDPAFFLKSIGLSSAAGNVRQRLRSRREKYYPNRGPTQ